MRTLISVLMMFLSVLFVGYFFSGSSFEWIPSIYDRAIFGNNFNRFGRYLPIVFVIALFSISIWYFARLELRYSRDPIH